jgi:hypothetical protein
VDGEGLGTWMVRRGVLDREGLRRARQRQSVYGGSLDTVVLELQLSDEPAVAACLTEASGLPAPGASWLEAPGRDLAGLLPLAAARKLGAQPVARIGDRLEVVTHPLAPLREIATWAGGLDLAARCYIVPEVRFEALLARVHGKPVPPRFATLLGRIVGRSSARRLAETQAPASRAVAQPLVETGPRPRRAPRPGLDAEAEPDLDVTEDEAGMPPAPASPVSAPRPLPPSAGPATPARALAAPAPVSPLALAAPLASAPSPRTAASLAPAASAPAPAAVSPSPNGPAAAAASREDVSALLLEWAAGGADTPRRKELARTLRRHLHQPALEQALGRWRAAVRSGGPDVVAAIEALTELRDREVVPLLLDRLGGGDERVNRAAQVALRTLTRHDFGGTRWRWSRWWREWKDRHRIEWLIDALTEKDAELRLEAAQELEELSGHYFGYHFDLGRREREEARRRWVDWWQNTGKASHS